mgnify:FL=1
MKTRDRYDYDVEDSAINQLNDNDSDVNTLQGLIEKYGKDVVLMWLSSGEYGDKFNPENDEL